MLKMIMFNFCSISYRRKRLKQTSPMMKNTRLSITFFATLKRETIQNKNTLFNKKIIFLRVVVVAQLTARSILIREEPGSNPVIGNLNWKTKCWMLVEKSKITKKKGPQIPHVPFTKNNFAWKCGHSHNQFFKP